MLISINLDNYLENRIQNIAKQKKCSAQWLMHEAINSYVNREEALESFKQEALTSWKSYLETGQHLTGQEVSDWLTSWGTDDERELPKCHK